MYSMYVCMYVNPKDQVTREGCLCYSFETVVLSECDNSKKVLLPTMIKALSQLG